MRGDTIFLTECLNSTYSKPPTDTFLVPEIFFMRLYAERTENGKPVPADNSPFRNRNPELSPESNSAQNGGQYTQNVGWKCIFTSRYDANMSRHDVKLRPSCWKADNLSFESFLLKISSNLARVEDCNDATGTNHGGFGVLIDLSVLICADASLIIKRQVFVSIGGPAINWKSNPRLHQSYTEFSYVATMYNS